MKKIRTILNGMLKDPIEKAIFTVPAFGFLSGRGQDIVGMHKRGYLKKELAGKVERGGLGIFSLEASILKYLSFPFGVSILCITRKT